MADSMMGHFCWNELASNDLNKAKSFYSQLFGWQYREIKTEYTNYTIVTQENKDIAGIWEIPAEEQQEIPPHWMAYISVANLTESLAKAKSLGATEVKGITQAGDMGHFAIVVDPTGAHFAMWEPMS